MRLNFEKKYYESLHAFFPLGILRKHVYARFISGLLFSIKSFAHASFAKAGVLFLYGLTFICKKYIT